MESHSQKTIRCPLNSFDSLWKQSKGTCLRLMFFVHGLLTLGAPVFAQLQPIGDLPRSAYYAGRDVFRTGNIRDATKQFERVLNVASQTGTDGWVDSIPPLVMLGECYYQQGHIARALEHYDAALAISIRFPTWPDYFSMVDAPVAVTDPVAKGIHWFRLSRPSRSLSISDSVQLMADLSRARADSQGNVVAPILLTARLDTTEVFRTLGIALMRRWQILGPLAKVTPLTDAAVQHFSENISQPQPWVQSSWGALRALANLARDEDRALPWLHTGTYVLDQFDYFLSPLCLMVQGQIAASRGRYQAAIVHYQDASILAAQYDQFDALADIAIDLGDAACANERLDLFASLVRAATWTGKRSPLANAAFLGAVAELGLLAGNHPETKKVVARLSTALRPRDLVLPRYQARLAFIEALIALHENNTTVAWSRLSDALAMMRGSAESGAIPSQIFRKQFVLDFLANGLLTQADADKLLTSLLAEPSATEWQLHPLETLATTTTSALPAYWRWLQTGDPQDAATWTARMDRTQREQLYDALPLAGRKFAWQTALQQPIDQLPADVRQVVRDAVQRVPALHEVFRQLSAVVEQVRQAPLPLDDRQVKNDVRQKYLQLESLVAQWELLILAQCVARQPLRRFAPDSWELTSAQQQLGPRDVLLSFVVAGDEIVAVAINNEQVETWIADAPAVMAHLKLFYQQIGLIRSNKPPTDVLSSIADWRQTSEQIYSALVSGIGQSMIESAERLILVPHGFLWYVPFEALIDANNMPILAKTPITYAPTLGSAQWTGSPALPLTDALVLAGKFFSLDKTTNGNEATAVANARAPTSVLLLDQKSTVPSSYWLQSRIPELVVANPLNSMRDSWNIRLWSIDEKQGTLLSDWIGNPHATPQLVILPGLDTSIRSGEWSMGNDVFLPVCAIQFGGSRGVISRWAVGGLSSSRYLQRTRQELASSASVSKSTRRATLALWSEPFTTSDEPILRQVGNRNEALTSGEHPLLWSSYMAIGN